MKVEFCENNKGYEPVVEKLKKNHPEIEIEIKPCLLFCEKCKTSVIARIDGQYIEGEDAEELLKKICSF